MCAMSLVLFVALDDDDDKKYTARFHVVALYSGNDMLAVA
jgi:hypothetical protein